MPAPKVPAERRSCDRLPCGLRTSCRPAAGAGVTDWPARVLDISERGVGLCLRRRFEPGTRLFFRLEGPCGHGCSLLARVVRVTPQGGGDWLLGCALAGPAGESDLRAFRVAAGEVARLAAEALRRGLGA